jgi:hypothetical protein
MRFRARLPRRRQHWFFSIIAMLAMTSQIVLALAPLAEGREDRMASHVEADGTQTHYAHSDGNCVSCQARSIHGTAVRTATSTFEGETNSSSVTPFVDRESSADVYSQSNPRAPPRLI